MTEENGEPKICPFLSQWAFTLQSTLALMAPGPSKATLSFQPVACMRGRCELWTVKHEADYVYEGCSLRLGPEL